MRWTVLVAFLGLGACGGADEDTTDRPPPEKQNPRENQTGTQVTVTLDCYDLGYLDCAYYYQPGPDYWGCSSNAEQNYYWDGYCACEYDYYGTTYCY